MNFLRTCFSERQSYREDPTEADGKVTHLPSAGSCPVVALAWDGSNQIQEPGARNFILGAEAQGLVPFSADFPGLLAGTRIRN